MKIAARLSVLATVVVAGLTLAATGTAVASAAPAAGHAAAVTSGTKLWEARYSSGGRGAFSDGSALSPDGSSLFVTGGARRKVKEPGADAATVIAYNTATGTALWQGSYNPGALSSSTFVAATVSSDSATVFAVGGTQQTVNTPVSPLVVAYDTATGQPRWTNATTPGDGPATSIALSPDGSMAFVTAGADIVAYNAATGAIEWTDNFGAQTVASNIAVAPDGSAVFSRVFLSASSNEVVAIAPATGTISWSQPLVHIVPQSLAVSPDSAAVYVAGVWGGSAGTPSATARTTALAAATGATLWAKDSKSPNGGSYANAVTVSPDGSAVYVTGSTTSAAKHAVAATWAIDPATGATLWLETLPAFSAGQVVAASPDGSKVFVSADASGFSGSQAFSTVAFDAATGTEAWVLGYHSVTGAWHSFPTAIEVSPDSSQVFVTGDVNTPEPGTLPTMTADAYSS